MRYRVGHFLSHYPLPGGTTTAVRGLCHAMTRLGWEAIIYCCSGNDQTQADDEGDGVRVVRFSNPRWNHFVLDRNLRARLSRNQDQVDLLVIHGIFNQPNVSVGKVAKGAGIPYIVWLHNIYTPELLRRKKTRKCLYGWLFERPLLNGAAAVHVFTAEQVSYLRDYGVSVPAFVVPNGFDLREVPEVYREGAPRGPRDGHTFNFLFLGRLDMHHKGLDLLLQAVSIGIRNRRLPTNVRLDLVGADWGHRHRLETLAARLRVGDFVRFVGRVAPAVRWDVLSSHDILVLPSRYDGFGLAALEAMVVGIPVIVSEEAGVSWFVREANCGYLVEPNPASICGGLVRAIETRDQWPAMGQRGKAFAYEHLTWSKVAQDATRALEEILGRSGASA